MLSPSRLMRPLRATIGAALGALVAAGPAVSVALADGVPGTIVVPAAPSWSGIYAGLHGGIARSHTGWTFPFDEYFNLAPGDQFSTHPSGSSVGAHLGVNQQMGRLVAGIEVAYDATTVREVRIGPVVPLFPLDRLETKLTDLFTATGRIGYAFDRGWLLYAKGGYANGRVAISALSGVPGAGVTAEESRRAGGWTGGGGLEYRLLPNAVLGLEYTYVGLHGARITTISGGTTPGLPFNVDVDDLRVHTLMARFSILFGR